jgi:hypothetical protein
MHYKNKNWLESQYAERSTYEIAKSEGVTPETIRIWLKKFNIARRDAITLNHLVITSELIEFMTGSMLGDGSLSWGHEGISAYYSNSSSRLEYMEWTEKKLLSLGIKLRGQIDIARRGTYRWWHIHSKYYRNVLPELRLKWYPIGKKIVPNDISLNANSLKVFYLDDGSFTVTRTTKNVCLAMNSFTELENKFIRDQLVKLIGSERIYTRCHSIGPYIEITKTSVIQDFFDFIGPCPKELESIFGYKWL